MTARPFVVALAVALVGDLSANEGARAQQTPPDESVLGTVEVNGSAGGWGHVPLQKLAVVPLVTTGAADSMAQLITKRDIDLSGQFDVIADALAPPGPWTLTTPIDWTPWLENKVEVIVRVYSQPSPTAGHVTLVGEIYLPPPKDERKPKDAGADAAPPPPPPPAKPAFTTKIDAGTNELRAASHRLVDALLGGLTGRPGSFASHMAFAGRVGKWRQIFVVDSDGFNLRPVGPANGSALSPVFGPGGEVFYTLSADFHRYKMVHGDKADLVPIVVTGSVLGMGFSPDRKALTFSSFENSTGTVYVSSPIGAPLRTVSTEPNANHPSIGPTGKIAYVAGRDAQRVYIDGKAISPGGFLASAPSWCDTEKGLLIVLTVGFGAWADVIAIDVNGGGIRRLTQGMGANSSASCSPDGRLVAFFSDRGMPGKGPGLYMVPIARPWLAKKIGGDVGEGLRWDALDAK